MKGSFCFYAMVAVAAAEPVRVQVTTGGHAHDLAFYEIFQGQKDWAVTVNPHPSAYRRDLRKIADVLVLYDMPADIPDADKQRVREFADAGKGVVVLHHALCGNWQWDWWWREVAGARCLTAPAPPEKRTKVKHDEQMSIRPMAKHPVTAGVGAFAIHDETYKGMEFAPGVSVLAETDHPLADRPVAWLGPHAKSRVVTIQLGHGPEAHRNPAYQKLVRNAVNWAAGVKQ